MSNQTKEFAIVIPLTQNKVAIIDLEDYAVVSQFKWHAHKAKESLWYARRSRTEEHEVMFMHRLVARVTGKQQADHKNGNGLDNRRENVRKASPMLNSANKQSSKTSPRPFKGVRRATNARVSTARPWRTVIGNGGREIFLGSFASPEEAAQAYDTKARELYGEFACVNFPLEGERQA